MRHFNGYDGVVDTFTQNDLPILTVETDGSTTRLEFHTSAVELSLADLKRLIYMIEYHSDELNTDNYEVTII
jgi:hypothetical protein